MRTRSESITKSSPRKISDQDTQLVEALVRTRLVQGWNLQKAEDAKLTASIWKQELDRHKINPKIYSILVDMAVDRRTYEIVNSKPPTPLTVELLIACYHNYRDLKLSEYSKLRTSYEHYRDLLHQYKTNQISLEDAVDQARFHKETDKENFMSTCAQIIKDLEEKMETFLDDYGINV